MDKLVKLIDVNFEYLGHNIVNNICKLITKGSNLSVLWKGFCTSTFPLWEKVSRFTNTRKKSGCIIKQQKNILRQWTLRYKTFAEKFDSIDSRSRKTKRLMEEIITISLSQSSVTAARYLQESVVDIKKSSICNYLKNTKNNK